MAALAADLGVRQTRAMTRAGTITAHLAALPAAGLLSLPIIIPSRHAVDIHTADTFFVVAHFHITAFLAACALVATFVAYLYGKLNVAILAAWPLFAIHAVSAILLWLRSSRVAPVEPATLSISLPSSPGLGYLYMASALLGLLAVLLGMVISLWKALRMEGRSRVA